MCFGLTNALDEFMDLMKRVSRIYLHSFLIIFVDDNMVYSKNEGEHMDHLMIAFKVLAEHQLFAKYRKCEFLF